MEWPDLGYILKVKQSDYQKSGLPFLRPFPFPSLSLSVWILTIIYPLLVLRLLPAHPTPSK